MPNKLSDWIHRQAAQLQRNGKPGKDNADTEREDSLKELCLSNSNSNAHRRPITPTAQSRPDSGRIPGNGPFFELPTHVREKIITAAFGDRALHLVLEYRQAHRQNPQSHAGFWLGQSARGPSSAVEWETTSTTAWRWRSCVCHRDPPTRKWSAMHISLDGCLQGEPMSCAHWERGASMPGKCLVGVMGWLLSCRQSYTETIGLLYSSNVFNFDDWSDTLRYIPQLILPQRLAALRYVEIQYCMRGKTVAETTQADTSPFDALLRSMPQVEIVHISLYGGDLTPLDRKPQMDKVDLKRQRMVYKAGERWTHMLTDGRLKHLYLAVPSSVYNRWQEASSRQSNQSTHDYPGPRFWRVINTPAPSSKAATESPSTENSGYWIVQGMDDYIPRESHCFQPS